MRLLACLCLAQAPGAEAAQEQSFDLPAQSLRSALFALATRADISIGLSGVDLANLTSRPLAGVASIEDALSQLLTGTGLAFERIDPTTWRIFAPPVSTAPRAPEPPTVPLTLPPIEEITVTASKRPLSLQATALSVAAVTGNMMSDYAVRSSGDLTSFAAGLGATNQGPGNNKFIIRGLSDGPSIGTTQSTVGVYLDETRVIFNAPLPNLQLIDIERVEVIRGPQGTLYGAGAIGGLVRIITRQPVLDKFSASGLIDGALSENADASGLTQAVINVPLVADEVALRAVAYARHDGGYINNTRLARSNVNDTDTWGVRAALGWRISPRWLLRGGIVSQTTRVADTQYFDRAMGVYNRGVYLAEPSRNRFFTAHLTAEGEMDWADVVSTTSWLSQDFRATYDASLALPSLIRQPVSPTAFQQNSGYRTINHESRLVSAPGPVEWLAGAFFSFRRDHSQTSLTLLAPTPNNVFYVKNRRDGGTELAVFGEIKYRLAPKLTAGVGLRLYRGTAWVNANNSELIDPGPADAVGENRKFGMTPKADISYQVDPNHFLYADIAQGFRLGGINIARSLTTNPGRITVTNFESDRLWNFEAGSKSTFFSQRISLNVTGFYAIWNNVQADLTRPNGLSFTSNLGTAHNKGFELEADFAPDDRWRLLANVAWSAPQVPEMTGAVTSRLPLAAKFSATTAAQYQFPLGPRTAGFFNAKYTLTGRTRLLTGAMVMATAPTYHLVNLRAGIQHADWRIAAYINNAIDSRASTYAAGNPFSLGRISQMIPPRPRTIGVSVSWAQ